MKHKTDTLEGDLLDAAVAMASGMKWAILAGGPTVVGVLDELDDPVMNGTPFQPSIDWSIGGPIIDREKILLEEFDQITDQWRAIHPSHWNGPPYASAWGPTALIAAMRAFAKAKLGNEVEIP